MIGPKPFPTLQSQALDLWRRMTLPPADLEERRVEAIHQAMGGVLPRDEVRRIVRAHRL
jgi:hypothetical protein